MKRLRLRLCLLAFALAFGFGLGFGLYLVQAETRRWRGGRLILLPFCSVALCFVTGFSSPQGATSCMANACTATQVSNSNFDATGSIAGVTGVVSS